ncbi:DUF2196 domain-containing protein [Halosimplex salinum]|uniref:DUF2196 domain-containing protein n=1 Tax=Halosimplex salinum TaxID=1710538 RepID=UPI000F466121|nr:DUF2196 domain-containing protein [Halosimplex salinum]
MAADLPSRDGLRPGMAVEVVRDQQTDESEPIVGDVKVIVTDERTHSDGIGVKLESGVTGRVKRIAPEV